MTIGIGPNSLWACVSTGWGSGRRVNTCKINASERSLGCWRWMQSQDLWEGCNGLLVYELQPGVLFTVMLQVTDVSLLSAFFRFFPQAHFLCYYSLQSSSMVNSLCFQTPANQWFFLSYSPWVKLMVTSGYQGYRILLSNVLANLFWVLLNARHLLSILHAFSHLTCAITQDVIAAQVWYSNARSLLEVGLKRVA